MGPAFNLHTLIVASNNWCLERKKELELEIIISKEVYIYFSVQIF